MTTREEFEAWLSERKGYSLDRNHSGVYMTLSTHELWMSWQASQAATLEEAMTPQWMEDAAEKIMRDLRGRKGILDEVDDEIQAEMQEEIGEIIMRAFVKAFSN